MFPSPLRYDVHWTTTLLRRDIKNLKSKCTKKLKKVFTKPAKASATPHTQVKLEAAEVEPECHSRVPEPAVLDLGNTELTKSGSANFRSSVATAAHTESSEVQEDQTQKGFTTLYKLFEAKLKELYTSRDRDMPKEERWKYRGSWLLLHMAVQTCPSNDSYDIFREGKAALDESKMLLELLHLSTTKPCSMSGDKVSKMSTHPYTVRNSDHIRYDSSFSTVSPGTSQPRQLTKPLNVPPPSEIWHAILEASTDHTKIISVAEDILAYAWPEKNATEVLSQIGHPGKHFHENAELEQHFREMLFPEYDMLVKGGC